MSVGELPHVPNRRSGAAGAQIGEPGAERGVQAAGCRRSCPTAMSPTAGRRAHAKQRASARAGRAAATCCRRNGSGSRAAPGRTTRCPPARRWSGTTRGCPRVFVLMVSAVWKLMVQLVPSKCCAVWVPALSTAAHASPGPAALTLWMKVPSSSGERDQLVPSKCHMPLDCPTQTSFGPAPGHAAAGDAGHRRPRAAVPVLQRAEAGRVDVVGARSPHVLDLARAELCRPASPRCRPSARCRRPSRPSSCRG